jgi:hypothetical protein
MKKNNLLTIGIQLPINSYQLTTMSETVLVTYAQTFNTNEIGSKFYNRDDVGEDKWNDLMNLFILQDNNQHIVLHDDEDAYKIWKKWLESDKDLKSMTFQTSMTHIGRFYAIFILNEM